MKTKPEKLTVKRILKAIENSGGIKQKIAERLNVHRHTIDRYERLYPTVALALKNEVERVIDKAESNVFQSIQDGDVEDSWKLLRYRGKDRGYAEKSEQKIEGTIENIIKVHYDDEED